MGHTSEPNKREKDKILESINTISRARVFISNKEEHALYEKYDEIVLDTPLLAAEVCKATIGDDIIDEAIRIIEPPKLFAIAEQRGQITTIPFEVLKSPINKNDDVSLITDYLLIRISRMKNNKYVTRTILLDTICEKLNKLNNTLKNEDIGSSIKISYAYFSKKELTLITTLKKAFNDQINDIIELKDEKIIAGSEDNMIKIYEKNGNPLYVLKGHTSGVRSLCLLKNDRFASGSADKTVRIWALKHQKTIKVLKDQSNPIISLTLLAGDKLASSSFREILIYDEHFAVKYKLTEHQNWVREFIPTEKERYASCSDDGLIKIYDKHFRTLYNLKEHNESVMSVCCLRDGRIVSGDKAGKIILWYKNFSNNKEIKEHTDAVMHIVQLKDGRVVTCSADKTIKVWDLDFRCLFTYRNHKGCVNRLVALRDGGFGSAGADGTLNFWR